MSKILKMTLIKGLVLMILLGGCATNKPRKLPKRGAIPCPTKDC